eukprot:16596-Lingulodinium_polyedra.AAC.1
MAGFPTHATLALVGTARLVHQQMLRDGFIAINIAFATRPKSAVAPCALGCNLRNGSGKRRRKRLSTS